MVGPCPAVRQFSMSISRCIDCLKPSLALIIALIFGCIPSVEASTHELSIDDAVDQALTSDPEIRMFGLQADAQERLKAAAKHLPEPSLRTAILNLPVDSFALKREPMTQALIGVRQTIPAIGSRTATSMNHDHLSRAFNHRTSLQTKNITLATRVAWLEAHYQRHAVNLTSRALGLLESLSDVIRARYASGDELQLAVLAAELELSRLQSRLIDTKRLEAQTLDELQRLLGSTNRVSIGYKLPNWDFTPTRKNVHDTLKMHPRVQTADSLISAESAITQLHETALKPEWHIDLSYGIRDGADLAGNARSDFASATVSFSLPFVAKQKHSLRLLAAQAKEDSARHSKSKILRDMTAEIAVGYSEWDRLTERLKLLTETIVAQSHNHAQAALKAYQNKEGSFTDVLLSYVNEVDVKLEQHRVKIDRLKAWAVIDSLNGSTK